MKLLDSVRSLFAGSEPDLDTLRQRLAAAQATLKVAKSAHETAQCVHANQALELMSRDDGGKALAASRANVDGAAADVQDVAEAIAALQARIAQCEHAATDLEGAQAWDKAAQLQEKRIAAAVHLQSCADALAAALKAMVEANEAAYAALPKRPDSRPLAATGGGLCTLLELYLFGHTDGFICRTGLSPHVARNRPDLETTARDLAVQLLAAAHVERGVTA